MNLDIPEFKTRTELFDFLVENKTTLINQKKAAVKHADAFSYLMHPSNDKTYSTKAEQVIGSDANKLFVRAVINTTGILDSHSDVHIKGLWKKSLSENADNYLCAEHDFSFKGIISDEVEAYTKSMSFKSLGFSQWDATTEALIYDSIVHKDRNPYMFEQYAKRRVKNHSVGMRYVKLYMCINYKEYREEYENWEKYIDNVVNRDVAEDKGYFWAVTEAKNIEGSPVVKGSNFVTPTLITQEKSEPPTSTRLYNEPSTDTQKMEALKQLLQLTKI